MIERNVVQGETIFYFNQTWDITIPHHRFETVICAQVQNIDSNKMVGMINCA